MAAACVIAALKNRTKAASAQGSPFAQRDKWVVDANGISFSRDSGAYAETSITVSMKAPEGCTIAYTTDGSVPGKDDDSGLSELSVVLDRSTTGNLISQIDLMLFSEFPQTKPHNDTALPLGNVLRAATVNAEGEVGKPATKVYFEGVNLARRFPDCLVVSIVTDPSNLLDYESGIMTTGAMYDTWKQTPEGAQIIDEQALWYFQANFTQHGKDWERPCSIQIFESGEAPAICQDAGLRMTGGTSRRFSQKSFNIFFRKKYGSKFLDYELFKGVDAYRSFRLRAGGNNTEWLKFKDAFLMSMVMDRRYAIAQSRKAVVFLNGEYWGPYLLSEKLSDQMIHDRYGVGANQVIMFKEGKLYEGVDEDTLLYEELLSFAEKDLTDPATWQSFCSVMDIQSMADYFATRIYIGDADWGPDKNNVLWKTRDGSYNGGRWQYVLYDIGYSSGLYDDERASPEHNHFRTALGNDPLFAAALRNREFYELFLSSIKQIGSANYSAKRVTATLRAYLNAWQPLMPDFYRRYGDYRNQWNSSVASTKQFFEKRFDFIVPIVENWDGS